jgi:hypothetical protein
LKERCELKEIDTGPPNAVELFQATCARLLTSNRSLILIAVAMRDSP